MSRLSEQIAYQLAHSESIIDDGIEVLSFRDLNYLVNSKNENSSHTFDAIAIRNRLPEIIQIVSHLLLRKNFLVLNGTVAGNHLFENIPVFCDHLISIPEEANSCQVASHATVKKEGSNFTSKTKMLATGDGFLVLKTSGTTNQPKFVLHDQEQVLKGAKRVSDRLNLDENDRVLIPVPVYHSYGLTTALMPALISGCSVKLLSSPNIIGLVDAINSFRPTVLFATPVLIEMMLKVKITTKISKVTISAGDRIREDTFQQYERQMGTLLNLYGSTEMGAIATSDFYQATYRKAEGQLKALPDVEFKVESDENNLLGEICCKNAYGYSYYINEFGKKLEAENSSEWFDTKDLGRLEDGRLLVLGRSDHKINRNGILLAYYEIEASVENACPEVKKAVVIKLESQDIMGTQFKIVCELKPNVVITEAQIRIKCQKSMNRNMMPSCIEIVTALPLLPNGKIDRRAMQGDFLEKQV